MLLATPRFWYRRPPTPLARLLQPLGWLYGLAVACHRRCSRPVRLAVPVVSLGNLTLGGTGKTPLGIALARALQRRGWRVAVLLRGYGAGRRQPCRVGAHHAAAAVGDEALEYVHAVPGVQVWAGADRVAAGRAAIASGANLLLLDDGLQHWRLARNCDLSLLDGRHGIGNGLVFPAGPLREPVWQLGRADLLVLTGTATGRPPRRWPADRPWVSLASRLAPPAALVPLPLLAFCGLGLPEKFFAALRQAGLQLAATASFADHHPYAPWELERLQKQAEVHGATLVTTVKDWQRLPEAWRPRVIAVPLVLDPQALEGITAFVLDRLGATSGVAAPGHG